MAKSELKTIQTKESVVGFIAAIKDLQQKVDAKVLAKLLQDVSKEKPKMWGSTIVGYGSYRYKYASGREGDWMLIGFSPRSGTLTIYIIGGMKDHTKLMEKLGKYTAKGVCLHIKKLSDVNLPTLKKLMAASVRDMRKKYKV